MPWYLNRKGEHLWYEDQGEGCPVVLVHGWCMSSAVWKYQLDGLADSMRLLTPDLRGHGRSRETSVQVDFDILAEDLIDLLDYLDLSQVVLVGWSMGAQIALQASAELSGRLAGIVLVSATPCFTASEDFPHALAASEVDGMRIKVQRNTQRALDGFYTRLFAEGEFKNNAIESEIKLLLSTIPLPDKTALLEALDALSRSAMCHLLAGITLPTLIVNGKLDRICLPEASCYLKASIPGAQQIVFTRCGHAPFLTYSHKFNTELIRFSRRVSEQNA